MNREIVHGLAALACLATSVLALPARAQAIQEYMYEPDKIYTVRTGLGITTQIELSPNEKIIDYSTGFSSGWELNRRENVFYLKPRNVDVDTNMMVRTARSEEHTSELQSLMRISYAVFCLKKKKTKHNYRTTAT